MRLRRRKSELENLGDWLTEEVWSAEADVIERRAENQKRKALGHLTPGWISFDEFLDRVGNSETRRGVETRD